MDMYQLILFKVSLVLLVLQIQCKNHEKRGSKDERNKFKLLTIFNGESEDGVYSEYEEDDEHRGSNYRIKPGKTGQSEAEVLVIDPRKILDKVSKSQDHSKISSKEKPRHSDTSEREDYEEYEGSQGEEDEDLSREKSKEYREVQEYPKISVKPRYSGHTLDKERPRHKTTEEPEEIYPHRKAMSWQQYVDTQICQHIECKLAVIAGRNDGAIWAKFEDNQATGGLKVTQEEMKVIADNMKTNLGLFPERGIFLGGEKYICLSAEHNLIRGRKGNSALCIVGTTTCLLAAATKDGFPPGQLNTVVERLADYLRNSNY